MATKIRVIIADDHEIFLEGLHALIKKQKDLEFVGQATNGHDLVAVAKQQNPDVIITDIKMPLLDGIEAAKQILNVNPETGIIALTMFDDEYLLIDMLDAGARGYLIKNAHRQEIVSAIQTVYQGENYFCNHTSVKLARIIAQSRFRNYKLPAKPDLKDTEKEIIRLICREFSNKQIADMLGFSPRTIESYRDKIIEKVNVKNTAGLVVYAIRSGIFKIE